MVCSPNFAYNKNKLHETLDYWSRDMLSFDFLEKDLGIVSVPHFASHVLLTDQISLSDCRYFLRYFAICASVSIEHQE